MDQELPWVLALTPHFWRPAEASWSVGVLVSTAWMVRKHLWSDMCGSDSGQVLQSPEILLHF